MNLDGTTVGKAFICSMCDDTYGVGLLQDGGRHDASATAAHELGHILCMDHDDASMSYCCM